MSDYCDTNQCFTTTYGTTQDDPLTKAGAYAELVRGDVTSQFKYIREDILGTPSSTTWDDTTQKWVNITGGGGSVVNDTMDAVTALMNFNFDLPVQPITFPEVENSVVYEFDLPPVEAKSFGNISDWSPGNTPSAGSLPSISGVNIPSFESSIGAIYIPPPPTPTVFTDPGDAPDSPGFIFPPAPTITLPDRPLMQQIVLPPAPNINLPTWEDLTFPQLETMNINTFINWSEPTYSPEIWTDVKAQIERFFAGGSGIRPEIEAAMVARGRDREDRLVRQQEMQATDEWAGRGYTAPPGMLVKRIDNIREEGIIKKLGLQREVIIKAMDEELANIRLGVQQGIVAEQMFVQIHLAAIERLFLVERLHVEWEIQKYNLLVEVFKAKLQENQIRAQVFEIQVRAEMAEIEVFKALIDAELAKAEINKTLIQAYVAEIQARESIVNLYKAQLEAVGIQASVFETEVKAYGETVSAFATRVNADKLRFDAYESQVRGEATKANVIEAEARAYQAEIGGIEVGVRAETAVLEGAISEFRANIDAYEARIRGQVGKNQAELAALQGNVAGYQADTQRYIAAANVEEVRAKVELAGWEVENRFNLAWFEAKVKEFEVTINELLGQKALIVDALKAAGNLSSTIAAGGLAALHASATISGQGSMSGTGTDSRQNSNSTSTNFGCDTSKNVNWSIQSATPPDNLACVF